MVEMVQGEFAKWSSEWMETPSRYEIGINLVRAVVFAEEGLRNDATRIEIQHTAHAPDSPCNLKLWWVKVYYFDKTTSDLMVWEEWCWVDTDSSTPILRVTSCPKCGARLPAGSREVTDTEKMDVYYATAELIRAEKGGERGRELTT